MKCKEPPLRTDRLFLNGITEKDAPQIVEWRSDPKVYPYLMSPHPLKEEEHRDWFQNKYRLDAECLFWMATQKGSGEGVGIFGIKRRKNDLLSVEVSYILAPECQGKGYAQEAVRKLLQFAKSEWGCREAVAEIHADNEKSLKLARRLGFDFMNRKDGFVLCRKTL